MEKTTTLFDMFGGIRPTARALGEPPSNVAAWKKEGRIPAHKQPHVLRVALSLGLPVTAEHVVFPLGRSSTDDTGLTTHATTVACDNHPISQRKDAA